MQGRDPGLKENVASEVRYLGLHFTNIDKSEGRKQEIRRCLHMYLYPFLFSWIVGSELFHFPFLRDLREGFTIVHSESRGAVLVPVLILGVYCYCCYGVEIND